MQDEFYVGYNPSMPPGVRRAVRSSIYLLLVVGLAAVVAAVTNQNPFVSSAFEFQQYRGYEGSLSQFPYPAIHTATGSYLLVGSGKFGAAGMVQGLDGKRVRLSGARIQWEDSRMLETLPDLTVLGPSARSMITGRRLLGSAVLTGEIADSKCHFGVMNPGRGKVHRDCAARCISGGVPPVLLARDATGKLEAVLLAGPGGRPLSREILDFVAEPVTIAGSLVRTGPFLVLEADPGAIRRE